jgi:hypothetical protein
MPFWRSWPAKKLVNGAEVRAPAETDNDWFTANTLASV